MPIIPLPATAVWLGGRSAAWLGGLELEDKADDGHDASEKAAVAKVQPEAATFTATRTATEAGAALEARRQAAQEDVLGTLRSAAAEAAAAEHAGLGQAAAFEAVQIAAGEVAALEAELQEAAEAAAEARRAGREVPRLWEDSADAWPHQVEAAELWHSVSFEKVVKAAETRQNRTNKIAASEANAMRLGKPGPPPQEGSPEPEAEGSPEAERPPKEAIKEEASASASAAKDVSTPETWGEWRDVSWLPDETGEWRDTACLPDETGSSEWHRTSWHERPTDGWKSEERSTWQQDHDPTSDERNGAKWAWQTLPSWQNPHSEEPWKETQPEREWQEQPSWQEDRVAASGELGQWADHSWKEAQWWEDDTNVQKNWWQDDADVQKTWAGWEEGSRWQKRHEGEKPRWETACDTAWRENRQTDEDCSWETKHDAAWREGPRADKEWKDQSRWQAGRTSAYYDRGWEERHDWSKDGVLVDQERALSSSQPCGRREETITVTLCITALVSLLGMWQDTRGSSQYEVFVCEPCHSLSVRTVRNNGQVVESRGTIHLDRNCASGPRITWGRNASFILQMPLASAGSSGSTQVNEVAWLPLSATKSKEFRWIRYESKG